jgi:outer membrane receptor protein involved in Fe transport
VHIAGATLRNLGGWSASLFVTRASADAAADDDSLRIPDSTAVNARLARRIFRHTTLTLDAFNLFDRRAQGVDELVASRRWSQGGMPEDFLVHPGEGRGVRLGIRWTFR